MSMASALERGEASGVWDDETDVLVFGSGAGGLAAALFGGRAGLKVLLCEKGPTLGGTTAVSGGGIWVPGTKAGLEAGDTVERAREYLQHLLGTYYRADLVDAYLANGARVIDQLDRETEVRFDLMPWPDYHSDEPGGAKKGRTLFPSAFDGSKLGQDFALLQPPMHRITVLGGLLLGPNEIDDFLRPWSSWAAFGRVIRKVSKYALDRLRYGRATDLRYGNALVARMLFSLPRDKVSIWTESPLRELIVEDGAVRGAVVLHDGRARRICARRGVVLATGGFAHNAQMRQAWASKTPHTLSLVSETNVGEGIAAGVAAGAVVDTDLSSAGNWTPASVIKESDGRQTPIIYGYLDRGRPGRIAVNAQGRRFVNESNSYHDIITAMFKDSQGGESEFYFICDRQFVRRHGLGLIRPWPWTRSLERFVSSGYITVADTLPELARKIGVNADNLVDTVEKHNGYCTTGVDPEFGRGSTAYNRMFGFESGWPNPNLAPLTAPPFVALRIHPATIGTTIGLKTDASARVLASNGEPIPGLYAGGNDLAAAFRGFYPGGGTTLGPAIVFGCLAVEAMQREASPA